MTTPELLPVIQRKNPEREFEILKQIGSGTYGEVFKVHEYIHVHVHVCTWPRHDTWFFIVMSGFWVGML